MAEWGFKWWRCFEDGIPKGAIHRQYNDAWMELHRLQPFSNSYAGKYGGWKIEEVTEDGELVTETETETDIKEVQT
jgi:hypothetical protein